MKPGPTSTGVAGSVGENSGDESSGSVLIGRVFISGSPGCRLFPGCRELLSNLVAPINASSNVR